MGCLNEEWEIWKLSYPRYARGKERSFKKIGLGRKIKTMYVLLIKEVDKMYV